MPAPLHNTNAVKPEDEQHTSKLFVRCLPVEKSRWVRAANERRMKLAAWVREILNSRSGQ